MPAVRTFVAVELEPGSLRALETLQRTLAAASAAEVNWVSLGNFHLTLAFLGELDDRDLVTLCRTVEKVAESREPFAVRLSGVGAFPTPRRPKTIFAQLTDGRAELAALHGELQAALLDRDLLRQAERTYTAHVTLGRVRSEADGDLLAPLLPVHAAWDGGQSAIGEVVVMASELRRGGPQYTAISRSTLGG